MIPSLLGLIANESGKWNSMDGNGHLRARLYVNEREFVALTLMPDGRYQVVECRIPRYDSQGPITARVVRKGRMPRVPILDFAGWPVTRVIEEAGLTVDKTPEP